MLNVDLIICHQKSSVVCFRNCLQSPVGRRWLNDMLFVYFLFEDSSTVSNKGSSFFILLTDDFLINPNDKNG